MMRTLRIGSSLVLAALALALLSARSVRASEETHQYESGESVILWYNKLGPYANPHETYSYYSLPYCKPSNDPVPATKSPGIGQVLEGTEFVNSGYEIYFARDTPKTVLCSTRLDAKGAEDFSRAVRRHYWYQMFLDDLPIWGMVGELLGVEEDRAMLGQEHTHSENQHAMVYTHRVFSISHNQDRIIEVNLTSSNPQAIIANGEYQFSYEVKWKPTDKSFDSRFNRYLDYSFFEHQIHWFSVFNSLMMVVFLCGLVALILLRTLRNDFARYARDDDLDAVDKGVADESGWKQVHGDVFRRPAYPAMFAAMLGSGYQLVALALLVTLVAIAGTLYMEHGAVTTSIIAVHALTSVVNGYVSGGFYAQQFYPHPAPSWIRTMLLSAILFPAICGMVGVFLNVLALSYETVHALPLGTVVAMAMIFFFVTLPLVVVGTILGRHWNGKRDVPCRVTVIPRPIPAKPWFARQSVLIPVTGVLPFGAIFIEMYFLFTSFWNYKFYYVYGFMLLVLCILIVVCACVAIVATYFLLNAEDYRWQWMSFLASGSTAGYVFLYSIYYFLAKTSMHGLLQTSFYFGYTAIFCASLFLMCGTIGAVGASVFVRTIYRNIKVE